MTSSKTIRNGKITILLDNENVLRKVFYSQPRLEEVYALVKLGCLKVLPMEKAKGCRLFRSRFAALTIVD